MANYILTVYFRTLDTLDIQVISADTYIELLNKLPEVMLDLCERNKSYDIELVSVVQGDRKGGIFG